LGERPLRPGTECLGLLAEEGVRRMNPTAGRRRGRPAVSSAAKIEDSAMRLFLAQGFDQTSMTEVARACGIGRTTLFRYFPTKADLVWRAFDMHLRRLAELLRSHEDLPIATAVQLAAVQAFAEAVDEEQLWRRRFEVQHETDILRSDLAVRWLAWAQTIADFVAERTGAHADDAVPAAVGGAVQATFAATLRTWFRTESFSGDVVQRMRDALQPVCAAMDRLLEDQQHENASVNQR
jgi:TetR/AcrR family transcriptional regulator, regulator of mycofactocin system